MQLFYVITTEIGPISYSFDKYIAKSQLTAVPIRFLA